MDAQPVAAVVLMSPRGMVLMMRRVDRGYRSARPVRTCQNYVFSRQESGALTPACEAVSRSDQRTATGPSNA
jgi:hypothetical protein